MYIYKILWLIWAAVVIGNIPQLLNWVNLSVQGSEQKVTRYGA